MARGYDCFSSACAALGAPVPVREHKFHADRKWRFDYAWPDHKVAVEVEGGLYSGGRHTRGAGYEKDMEKYNRAALDGWTLLRFSPSRLLDGVPEVLEALGL